jgi:prepilin-type N-terminal cleavage/methylation domain-containing protein
MKTWFLDEKGVSLVELMVVLVILTIAIIPIARIQSRANRDVFESGQRTIAVNIAQTQMEQAKSLGFAAAAADSGQTGPFQWQTAVQPQGWGMSSVAVTVQWIEDGDPQNITVTSLLSTR